MLMDLQVNGGSRFTVTKGGVALAGDGSAAAPSLSFLGATSTGLFKLVSSIGMSVSGTHVATLFSSGFGLGSARALFWDSTTTPNGNIDLALYRDAAGTLAQRNSTNAQAFRVYNTYTDAANYERLEFMWSSNIATIQTLAAGTGVGRVLNFSALSMGFYTSGTQRWLFNNAGNMIAATDNTYDIGASGANRPRDLFLGRNLVVAGTMGLQSGASSTTFFNVAAGVTGASQLRLNAGVAPSAPVDGDMWFDGSALKMRIAGVTKTVTVT